MVTFAASAVEDEPADVIAQPLIVEDELADPIRKLVALPSALRAPGSVALTGWRCGTHGLDGVCGCAEFVRRHSMAVLGGNGSIAALIDINTAIMKGLRGNAEAAA